jgi:hypothetical protein
LTLTKSRYLALPASLALWLLASPAFAEQVSREQDIIEIVRWLRAPARPHYAVMPAAEYAARQKTWNLPATK